MLSWPGHVCRSLSGLSVSMRLAACATVILALVTGAAIDGTRVIDGNVLVEQEKELYGLGLFAPVPPGSIGSVYIAMADQPKRENR